MKKKVIWFSKIVLVLFFVVLAVMIVLAMRSDTDEIIMSNYIGIPCLIVAGVTIITYLALFVLEAIELFKEKRFDSIAGFFVEIVILGVILYICKKYIGNESVKVSECGIGACAMSVVSYAINYWKRV